MNKICFALGACFVFCGAVAGVDDWVFNTSGRAAEVISSASAGLTGVFDSRTFDFEGSVSGALDSRWGESEASAPQALDTTKIGFSIIIR